MRSGLNALTSPLRGEVAAKHQGYRVIRFWNTEVHAELDAVLDTIFAIVQQPQILLAEADSFHPTPAPRADPPPYGEGEE
ncbi:DUF559 domain-containing protein [Rhizobium sp. HT1-10]|uniref:DUF559 domain-containing protein n=1 Tax=Rhizobium sp. HT1-10 TaxID=3111638 RepID=UPI003C2831E9